LIAVIRTERDRRIATLEDEDPDYAADRWLFTDEPFLNELGREALALSLNLDNAADYSAIAEEFLSRSERLVADVEQQLGLSPVKDPSAADPLSTEELRALGVYRVGEGGGRGGGRS
jgi:hypothetical protein